MRSDVYCRHLKQHWKEATDAMGEEKRKRAVEILCPLVYSITEKNKVEWVFCGVCGKGECRNDKDLISSFLHDHKTACSAHFDSVKYMFDHSIPKPIQTRVRSKNVVSESTDEVLKVVTRVVEKSPISYTLESLRKQFPLILTNIERNQEYAEAKEDDPEGEFSIDDYGDDNLSEYNTMDKALERIFDNYKTISDKKTKSERLATKNKAEADALRAKAIEYRDLGNGYKQTADSLQDQLIKMKERLELMERLSAAKDKVLHDYGFNEAQVANDIASQIANHINGFSS